MSNERLIDNVVFAAKDDGTFEANILREDGVLSDVNPFYYASLRVDKGVLRISFRGRRRINGGILGASSSDNRRALACQMRRSCKRSETQRRFRKFWHTVYLSLRRACEAERICF